jgi:hypothetical protein
MPIATFRARLVDPPIIQQWQIEIVGMIAIAERVGGLTCKFELDVRNRHSGPPFRKSVSARGALIADLRDYAH